MLDLSHHSFLQDVLRFLLLLDALFLHVLDLQDIVLDGVEAPEGQHDEMASLGILAFHTIQELIMLVQDFKFLEFLGQATAVKDCCLDYAPHVFVVKEYFHFWAVVRAAAHVQVSE